MPSILGKRDTFDDDCNYYNGRCHYNRSDWYSYGRWIVVAALIGAGILLFFVFACVTARRRRAAGFAPYRGTGWAGGRPPAGHAPAQYTGAQPYYGNNQMPPNANAPPYGSPPNQGHYSNADGNQGYFGGQQNGVELQQPQSAYQPQRGGDPVYNPPSGPPPGKGGDGIIR